MCGRFTLTVSARLLADLFDIDDLPDVEPRYNIAPTQPVLIVRLSGHDARVAPLVHWGLIPSWAKDKKIGARMINARGETAASKPSFRSAVRKRRCLIPADGFYEWQKLADKKQPHHFRFGDRRPFAFAGLWERWIDPDGERVDSCTIITTTPNDLVREIHDRMPVILDPADYEEWLEPVQLTQERLDALLVPHPPDDMEAVAVSTTVNNPRNDSPVCIEPLS
jgi:putative SOS response-associated peptidase YedK